MSRGSSDFGWDRDRARFAVGEGFPCPLFRLRDGVTVSPWRTFSEAPLKSWTVGFPESSSKPWHITVDLPKLGEVKTLVRVHPCHSWFAHSLTFLSRQLRLRRFYQAGRLDSARRPPSVQSPFAQLGCYLRWRDVFRLLGGRYPSVIARTGSCAAPVELSPPSAFGLVWRVLAGCNQSLLPTAASRRYSENLSLDAGSPTPAVHRLLTPVSSTVSSAFPNRVRVGFPRLSCERLLAGQCFEDADIS